MKISNDIYREAWRMNIRVASVEVEVQGDFGEPAKNVTHRARLAAESSEEQIRLLIQLTDKMAEIQNMLRVGMPVELTQVEAVPVAPLSGGSSP